MMKYKEGAKPKEGDWRECPECHSGTLMYVQPEIFCLWSCECGYEEITNEVYFL